MHARQSSTGTSAIGALARGDERLAGDVVAWDAALLVHAAPGVLGEVLHGGESKRGLKRSWVLG